MLPARRTCLLPFLVGLALAGCQGTGITTGPGSIPDSWTFRTGAPAPSPPVSNVLGPPPALLGNTAGAATPAAQAGPPPQGRYVGEATVSANPLDLTCDSAPINDFEVHGNSVSLGGFLGHINPDGSVEMQAGPRYLFGRFIGAHFVGTMNNSPGCSYTLSLHPA